MIVKIASTSKELVMFKRMESYLNSNRIFSLPAVLILIFFVFAIAAENHRVDKYTYDSWEEPATCGECHVSFYTQWRQAMMSQSFTHHWDEIEYFKLALPQAEKDEVVAEVKAGCNGCHSPMAYLTGDIPPARPSAGTRANDGVHCDLCHTITGHKGEIPHNFNYVVSPGEIKYGPRADVESGGHEIQRSDYLGTAEFCGICHNEKDPYGIWVKSTQLEWKEGPYAAEGVACQDCHMTYTKGRSAEDGVEHDDLRLHLFNGAHDPSKMNGVVEIKLYADINLAKKGEVVTFTTALFNQKAGHKFPTGSVEDRILWLHVEAVDAAGNVYHLPVEKKGFAGEEFTMGSDELAYQDMGIALNDPDFKGVERDGVPVGDRIFRMPYLDPQGRMTIQQWNTKALGVDYRFGPRETKMETYTFKVPEKAVSGLLTVTAELNFQLLVKPVADFLGVPEDESRVVKINQQRIVIEILP
jgi:hypothetical protein